MTDRRTIAFFPEPGAWGPTNNCVAIADVLAERGHRIVFVVDESFEGVLAKRGFEERLMRMAPPEENADPNADPWAEFIRVTAPEFRRPTIEQIATVTKPIWEALVAGERYSHDRLMQIWEDVRPDAVVTDNVTGYPAVELGGLRPGFASCRRTRSRCAIRSFRRRSRACRSTMRSEWQAFREEYHRQHEDLLAEHNDFRASVGVAPCPPDEFNTKSPWLNLYLFPERRPTTLARARSARPGTASSRRSAPATRPSTSPSRCPATARWSTCRSARSDAWTSG